MRRDTRGWRECHWKENSLGRQWVEHWLFLEKDLRKTRKNIKHRLCQASGWKELLRSAATIILRNCLRDESSEGAVGSCTLLCRPQALMDPGPLGHAHKWVISALTALHLQPLPECMAFTWLKSNLLPYQVLVDRNLCLPAEHANAIGLPSVFILEDVLIKVWN